MEEKEEGMKEGTPTVPLPPPPNPPFQLPVVGSQPQYVERKYLLIMLCLQCMHTLRYRYSIFEHTITLKCL